jgi:di/tricarboxylate transporter
MLLAAAVAPLGWPALLTAITIVVVLVMLALDAAPTDLSMLGALIFLTALGIVPAGDALGGFANEALLTVAALFVVADAVRKTGALSYVSYVMTPRSNSTLGAVLRMMLPAAVLSSVINNTPIVAILAPLAQERGRAAGIAPSKLLIPLAYATTLGGLITLVGTSTNLVVSGLLVSAGHPPLRMFDLTWVGVPATLAGVLYFIVIGHKLLPDRDDDTPLDRDDLRAYHFELRVPHDSPLDGRTVESAGLRALKGAFLAHIYRDGEFIGMVAPEQVLRRGDVLAFVGKPQHLDLLLREGKLHRVLEPPQSREDGLHLFEAVVGTDSSMVGKTLREVGFRRQFQAIVLGIRRGSEVLTSALGRTPIAAGDLLLVEARPQFEAAGAASHEFSLVAPLERRAPRLTRKGPVTLIVLLVMLAAIGSGVVPVVIAAVAAALLLIASGATSSQDGRRSVDISVLVTIAAGFGIAQAIQSTGLAAFLADILVHRFEAYGPVAVLVAIYVATNLLTEMLSNNAAAALVFPIALAVATSMGVDVVPFAVAVAVAASAAFATPIGYHTYLMVMAPGSYRLRDFVRVGLPLNFIVMAVAIPIIVAVWL